MLRIALSTVAVSLLALSLSITTAQAQNRVFVAAQGLDSNPCTFAQPCRTFQHAHDVVAANGEIDVLDPAGYGALTITKAISIQGHGFAGISATSGDAITVTANATDKISLRGLLIDGVGTGSKGIALNTGSSLDIQDTLIRNFINNGLYVSAGASATLLVSNTQISDIVGNIGSVEINGTVTGVFDHVVVARGGFDGIFLNAASPGAINLTLSNSLVTKHSNFTGIDCRSSVLLVQNSTIAHNGVGLSVGQGAIVRVTRSAITNNVLGFNAPIGSILESFGDNVLRGNNTDGAPTSTIPLK
jgi:hypothetical protein